MGVLVLLFAVLVVSRLRWLLPDLRVPPMVGAPPGRVPRPRVDIFAGRDLT
jgi:hypothetical protein